MGSSHAHSQGGSHGPGHDHQHGHDHAPEISEDNERRMLIAMLLTVYARLKGSLGKQLSPCPCIWADNS